MKTLVINMENDTQRLSKMKNQFTSQNIDYTVIKAVDGSNHDLSNVTKMCKMICTNSMIGIMSSHIKCWKHIIDNNLDKAIILEDDTVLEDNFISGSQNLINSLHEEDKNTWELILLGCFLCSYNNNDLLSKFIMKVNNPRRETSDKKYNDLLYVPSSWGGAHAYILSNKGARKLLSQLSKVSYHVDFEMAHADIHTLAARKKLANQNANAQESHNASSKSWMNVIKIDKGELDPDFVLTMPACQLFGIKITTFLILQIIAVISILYYTWKMKLFKHIK